MALTDDAIAKITKLIRDGELSPGSRLPPEQQLAAQLGLSRNSMREAVKALEVARVLDVRRGDGTYVTSLEPGLLLQSLGFAIDLLSGDTLLEVLEVRRLLEPTATSLAAQRMTPEHLAEVRGHLEQMADAGDDIERLVRHDAAFHRAVVHATGNETLVSILDGVSGRTVRGRVWHGIVDAEAAAVTLAEHRAIFRALESQDGPLAQAAALVHVHTSESWLRNALGRVEDEEGGPAAAAKDDAKDAKGDTKEGKE
ncbi:GntR family transcriptional regulator [Mangrovactinospora gilvigrisea]|uniref:GntR family transcriptional regulator n=1 Tax=Mangrovactinospora gilvigrisea TaxID=1428644 RepID=A0A1J7BQT6_9ACTN|nr:FadR/GntR family transcriptional regulator [Mangrovactinospora gilvigrisea]OIV35809.1 GntR family transcriptional regulator [Mangrovactinospora gilvigrisea]